MRSNDQAANELRQALADLLDLGPPDRLVLAPGVAVALTLVLDHLRVSNLVMSTHEYLDSGHFPGRSVQLVPIDRTMKMPKSTQAILVSPWAWDGFSLPAAALLRSLRRKRIASRPLLIADWSHAGAAGFPSPKAFGADIVCGEVTKWLLPPKLESGLAFLWCNSRAVWNRVAGAFRKYYLATPGAVETRMARWVRPNEVHSFLEAISTMTRNDVLRQNQANQKLAERLTREVPGAMGSGTAIVCVPEEASHPVLGQLKMAGLTCPLAGGQIRVLCRAKYATLVSQSNDQCGGATRS